MGTHPTPVNTEGARSYFPKLNFNGGSPKTMKELFTVLLLILSFSLSGCLLDSGQSVDDTFDNSESCDYWQVPDFEIETLNRTNYEGGYVNETGWFQLSEHRGKAIILDFMAKDAVNSHYARYHIESKLEEWNNSTNNYPVMVVSIGSWYDYETLQFLNESNNQYNYYPPNWILGIGNDSSVILNESEGSYGDMNQNYGVITIPVTMIIDHEGYLIHIERTGTPADEWESFDAAVESGVFGDSDRYCMNN